MSGDPLDNITRISWDDTYDTTATTSVDQLSTTAYTISYSYSYYQSDVWIQKIKELLRKERIRAMKSTWNTSMGEFHPRPKLRPSVQLRGVCLNGRGWA